MALTLQVTPENYTEFVVNARKALGRKFEAEDVTLDLQIAALHFLNDYTGDFSYILETIEKAKTKKLTDGQVKGVLNTLFAQWKNSESTGTGTIPEGEYEDGEVKAKVEKQPANSDFCPGELIAYFKGAKKWIGFGFVKGSKIRVWGSKESDDRTSPAKELLEANAIGGA